MSDADELKAEGTELDRPGRGIGLTQLRRLQEPVLVELRLHEPERESRRPYLRDRDLAEEIWEGADVVFVTVREHDRANAPGTLAEIGEVGQDQVDAEVLVAREGKSGVDDENVAVGLEGGHVLADLAETPERDDPQGVSRHPPSLVARSAPPALRGVRRSLGPNGREGTGGLAGLA